MRKGMLFALLLLLVFPVHTQASRTVHPDAAQINLVPFAGDFNRLLYATHAGDGTGRLFAVEQGGLIYVVQPDGTRLPAPFLDVSGLISADALGSSYTERGLLGLAFHPDYATNGTFFINYTQATSHDTVVARYRVSEDPNIADASSAEILFTHPQPFGNHNGGHLDFGPDGYLYVSLGDGGSAGDPQNNGQRPETLLGTLLRIDVNTSGDLPYGIPADNPFVGDPAGADEIWAWGLRNVWRFSFDRATGDLYMGDVGQNRWEEVNYQPAGSAGGQNYGWNALEGTNPFSGAAVPEDAVMPFAEYQHANGNCSVTGGYVYRGSAVPALDGAYVYGDFCSGQLWSAFQDNAEGWSIAPFFDTPYTISSFGEDEAGELYLLHYGGGQLAGQIFQFAANS